MEINSIHLIIDVGTGHWLVVGVGNGDRLVWRF